MFGDDEHETIPNKAKTTNEKNKSELTFNLKMLIKIFIVKLKNPAIVLTLKPS